MKWAEKPMGMLPLKEFALFQRWAGYLVIAFEEVPRAQRKLLYFLALVTLIIFGYLMCSGAPLVVAANFTKAAAPLVLLSMGAGIVLAAGKVDVSIAGVATLGGVIFAQLASKMGNQYYGFYMAGALACVVGILFGLINGWFIARRAAPSLLVTWSTGTLASMLAAVAVHQGHRLGMPGQPNSVSLTALIPVDAFQWSLTSYLAVYGGIIALVVSLLMIFRLGRLARAIGSSEKSTASQGFRVGAITMVLYAVSSGLATIAGCFAALATSAANTDSFMGDEMAAIAIAVLGGTAMSGGYFSILGIFVSVSVWTSLTLFFAGQNMGLGVQESWATNALFAAIVLISAGLLGRAMSGEARAILVDDTESL